MELEKHVSFLVANRDAGAPGNNPPPAPPPPKSTWLKLTIQIVVIVAVFVGFTFAVWMILPGGYRQTQVVVKQRALQQQKHDQELAQLLETAQLLRVRDRLTTPSTDNALATYLRALKFFPDAREVQNGIEAIGARYLEMIKQLLAEQDLALLEAVMTGAGEVEPYVNNRHYHTTLAQARQQLASLRADRQRRRDLASAADAPHWQSLKVYQDRLASGAMGPKMVMIPGGLFLMGSDSEEPGRDRDEGPQFLVKVGPFAIGQAEVTFAEYDAFAKATRRAEPFDHGWGRGDRPAITVSWEDARDYTIWLSAQTGARYRLPTEAEWEYAARAGTTSAFVSGACLSPGHATFDDGRASGLPGCEPSGKQTDRTQPVTGSEPNAWGLYEVHGNVREWVRDCWDVTYEGRPTDGSAWYVAEGGECGLEGQRVLRGGAWNGDMRTARIANRYGGFEHAISNSFGFRVVRDLD